MTWIPVLSGNHTDAHGSPCEQDHSQGFDAAASPQPALGQMLRVPERFPWLSAVFESLGWILRNDTAQAVSLPVIATHCHVKYADQLYLGGIP